ncbi:MAG TPA: hypothetical protein VFH17_02100 [Coriobacteriia bacterium]|nr:hypothetical protein [Coriobacteriia bacterium]
MLRFREITLGPAGDVACRRCAAVPVAFVEDDWFARLDTMLSGRTDEGVLITGTGAVSAERLAEAVRRCVDRGVSRVAVRVREPGVAVAALESGARTVEVALLGPAEALHDGLAGEQGSFVRARETVRSTREWADASSARVSVRAIVPVCPHNLREAPATVTSCAEAGVDVVVLACVPTLDPRRSAEWVGAACDTGTVNRVWVSVRGLSAESLGAKALHAIDALSTEAAPL